MTQEWDAAIAALAGRQRTLLTHGQLLAIGCSRRTIAHWVDRGRLHPVFHGVYSVIRGELPPLGREQAALLACGKRAFLSHRSAAGVWGLVPKLPFEVEVSVVGGVARRGRESACTRSRRSMGGRGATSRACG